MLIKNCSLVTSFFDRVEELRDLTLAEWNLRGLVKDKAVLYMRYKQLYWQKRCTIRWVKFGGENTKFFHAAATERYRRNLITHLKSNEGVSLSNHAKKAAVI